MTEKTTVRIAEAYRDYNPPIDAVRIVQNLLDSVPEKYLRGLDCVVLTNTSGLSRRDRIGRPKSRGRRYDKARVLGRYHPKSGSHLPYIELRMDKILSELNGKILLIPPLRDFCIGLVLFHEVGHHIHLTIRPEYSEKENVADRWGKKLGANFVRKHYWYALPVLIPAAKVYKFMRRRHWI